MVQCNFLKIKNHKVGLIFILIITIVVSLFIINIKSGLPVIHFIQNFTFTRTNLNEKDVQCIVYFIERSGRLGNRMFMFAAAYGLARLHSCHLYLTPETIQEMNALFVFDLFPYLIPKIMFNTIVYNPSKPVTKIRRRVTCQYFPDLTRPNAIAPGSIFLLEGYWQSYLHFDKYRDDLRNRIFVARQPILERVSKLFIQIYESKTGFKSQFSLENHQSFKKQLAQSNWTTWVGIHVRRSDFLPLNFSSSDEYLLSAIDYYSKRYSNAHFIVASDDKSYCRKLFRYRKNIFLTPESFSQGEDLIALSLCQHSIVTAGTFGWWTAYLANGRVIHDKLYPSGCDRREHYYPPWFMIDGYVRAHINSNYTL